MAAELRLVVLSAIASARVVARGGSATLAQRLGVPAPTLLDSDGRPFVQRWVEVAAASFGTPPIFVVANSAEASALRESCGGRQRELEIAVDRGDFRGPAGALRDLLPLAEGSEPCTALVVVEASSPPVEGALEAVRAMVVRAAAGKIGCVHVAADAAGTPLGVAMVPLEDLALVAPVGYQDFKEQFLPALHAAGRSAAVLQFDRAFTSLRSREQYLALVARGRTSPIVDGSAKVSDAADIRGASVVGRGASIARGAVVLDSVVLPHARIGQGAVVARSVVGPRAVIGAGEFVADEVAAPVVGGVA